MIKVSVRKNMEVELAIVCANLTIKKQEKMLQKQREIIKRFEKW